MNFTQECSKGHYNNNEEDQEEDQSSTIIFPFSSSSSNIKPLLPQLEDNYNNTPMELSLSNVNNEDRNAAIAVEKEHMFDKSVTPSDVGKLNRLVIPKQHAEKYFPLDSSSNEKGLLLNFEDRNGKPWRFRYSYWNSSQSYVMTKGWSRFVKEKKLDAGDIVSFQRGVGELGKDRLYIDWRRRPEVADPISNIQIHNHLLAQSMNWGRVYSNSVVSFPRNYDQFSYGRFYQHQQQQLHSQSQLIGATAGRYYLTSAAAAAAAAATGLSQIGGVGEGLVIDSIPVSQKSTANNNKRLRLFGVNMECSSSQDKKITNSDNTLLRLPSIGSSSSDKGKCSSLSFDLDL